MSPDDGNLGTRSKVDFRSYSNVNHYTLAGAVTMHGPEFIDLDMAE